MKISELTLLKIHALGFKKTYNMFNNEFLNLPLQIKEHRSYFEKDMRGFGERAFHTFWFWLLNYYSNLPSNDQVKFLEIGVYRGQTLTLLPLIASLKGISIEAHGISPLNNSADEVSSYPQINYREDILLNARKFQIENNINLIEGLSTDTNCSNLISKGNWDIIYIDGSHDYDTVYLDCMNSIEGLNRKGLLILDDSSLYTKELLPLMRWRGFPGHPGPSKVVENLKDPNLIHLLSVGHLNAFQKI